MRLAFLPALVLLGCGEGSSPSAPDSSCIAGCTCWPNGAVRECPDVRPPSPDSMPKAPGSGVGAGVTGPDTLLTPYGLPMPAISPVQF